MGSPRAGRGRQDTWVCTEMLKGLNSLGISLLGWLIVISKEMQTDYILCPTLQNNVHVQNWKQRQPFLRLSSCNDLWNSIRGRKIMLLLLIFSLMNVLHWRTLSQQRFGSGGELKLKDQMLRWCKMALALWKSAEFHCFTLYNLIHKPQHLVSSFELLKSLFLLNNTFRVL